MPIAPRRKFSQPTPDDMLKAERDSILYRYNWPNAPFDMAGMTPEDQDRLIEIARLRGLPNVVSDWKEGEIRNRMIRLRDGDDRLSADIMAALYPLPEPEEAQPRIFDVGEVVQLKSGGPGFTVIDCHCLNCVELAFFEGAHFEQVRLPRAALQPFDPAKAGLDIPF